MFGWIFDGISSLFEPVTGQSRTECPAQSSVSAAEQQQQRRRQENRSRAAKRSYHSVDGVGGAEPIAVKRRRRDVLVSLVKRTALRIKGLLRRRSLQNRAADTPGQDHQHHHDEETQSVTLMGIDELSAPWPISTQWRMAEKTTGGVNDRNSRNLFSRASPPSLRKYSGSAAPPAAPPERGKERRASLQLLTSRSVLRSSSSDPTSGGFAHSRCYKASLAVEEDLRLKDQEHYRRLLEMVSQQYSRTHPLPFSHAHSESVSQTDHRPAAAAAAGRPCEPVPRRTVYPAAAPSSMFTWRSSASSSRDRCSTVTLGRSVGVGLQDPQSIRTKAKQNEECDLSAEVAARLNLGETPSPGPSQIHTRPGDEDLPKLTKEMAADVFGALAQTDPNLVLSSAFKLRITQRDLSTLQEGGWLNDEVINFYLSLIVEQRPRESPRLKVYSFSTFFFPKLRGRGGGASASAASASAASAASGGHAAVKRWTKSVDLFLFDLVLVPLHLGVHWALAVIDVREKTVKSYDSMGQRHEDVCSLLLCYLREEHRVKRGRDLDSKWTLRSLRATDLPQQKNSSDCGVFVCKYADFICRGRNLSFRQCHMPLFRKLMIWEILHQRLL